MKRKTRFFLFILMVVLQLAVPLSMIQDYQGTLKDGQLYKFKASPVDPYDPFQGRYLWVNIDENQVQVEDIRPYQSVGKVYVTVENDNQGYARLSGISIEQPVEATYLETKISYIQELGRGEGIVHLQIPFDRYYMPETQAIAAEEELAKVFRENTEEVYVTVKINQGNAVLEGVYVSGRSIEEIIAQGSSDHD